MAFFDKKTETRTNAPPHWPKVSFEQFENKGINLILLAGALAPVMKPPASSLALMESFVYDDGVLEVPIIVIENGKKTGVFVYGAADADASARYSAVRSLMRTRENAGAVYYGPQSLAPAPPAKVLKPIDTPMFSKPSQPRDGRFALWWPTPEDPRLADSPDRALLDTWFERLNGYGYLLFTAFVNDLKLVEQKGPQVYALPEQPLLLPLAGPGHTDVMLYAAEHDGILLGFDEETTSVSRRHVVLRLLADFAVAFRKEIDKRKVPARPEERGHQSWIALRDALLKEEQAGEQGLRAYFATMAAGRITRAEITSDAQRAAQHELPGQAILDFGIDLAERVAERLKSRPIVPSTNEKLAGPNLFAVIAAKAGGRVYERLAPYENPDVVQRAAANALEEWPDAEVIAVLVDAAIREHGVRVDILDVRVQQAGAVSSASIMQRYKATASGSIELAGHPTVMASAPFLVAQPPAPPPSPAPSTDLMALVNKAAAEIARMEAFGKALADSDDTPRLPYALIADPTGNFMHMKFALQGPLTAADSCVGMLKKAEYAAAPWVAYVVHDLVRVDDIRDRRIRLCVHRRGEPATAMFDWRYEGTETDGEFRWKGDSEFKRWGPPLMS